MYLDIIEGQPLVNSRKAVRCRECDQGDATANLGLGPRCLPLCWRCMGTLQHTLADALALRAPLGACYECGADPVRTTQIRYMGNDVLGEPDAYVPMCETCTTQVFGLPFP